ncbi:hypothetical protein [Tuwongella immobilis]|uniref:Lipocalin-like domain-containing protein n=1 Tax=Tuwongella immobilis TaxID=692036 RepID=A0A6C2YUA5_9BACT|nr:hypothetical protein [Tuwongella immobilis]VIP05076.1 unnamed protein product [Tuwongella immobilis]VTS07508.1 unnamed protein product [Tuwongella immobilis]
MRSTIGLLVAALVLTPTSWAVAQTPDVVTRVESELAQKRLQGVWIPQWLVTKPGVGAYPLSGRALIFERDTVIRTEGKRTVASGTFSIESGLLRLHFVDRQPWDLEHGPIRSKLNYSFKIDGDLLTLCLAADDKLKPTDCAPGEGRQVVIYQRQQLTRPSATPKTAEPKSATPE